MVGVPGRSKGCHTCRKRRVKCDEAKPHCRRCIKGKFECLGYTRHTLWRHTSTAPFPELARDGAVPVLLQEDNSSPPPEMSLVAFQPEFCYSFMFANFVWRSYGNPWLELAAKGKLGPLALDATKALSQANFGKSNRKLDIELTGVVQYGKCLKTLAGELGGGPQAKNGPQALLIPILIMLMHSGSHTDRTGSIFHLKGIARLLYLCGPEAFQQQPLLNAFDAARATLLVASLISKQRLFLDEERWRTVPWALNPTSKTPQSELLDILVIIPGILCDHAAWELDPDFDPTAKTHLELFERVHRQLIQLFQWRWRWQEHSGDFVCTDKKTIHSNGAAAVSLGSIGSSRQLDRLMFAEFTAAAEMMLYNATLMWLFALLWKISPLNASACIEACAEAAVPENQQARHTSFEPLRRPGGSVTIRDPAMEICRVFEWVTRHHSQGQESTFLYLFPVGMALSVLEDEPEAKKWIRSLLNSSSITANYSNGENPGGFGFYITRQSLHPEEVRAKEVFFSPQEVALLVEQH